MKKKYISEDSRTGVLEGNVVELTDDELNKKPFNVKFKLLEPVDDKEKLEKADKKKDEDELRISLLNKGLSTQRTERVLDEFSSKDELVKNVVEGYVDKSKLDELTKGFLKKEFGTTKSSTKPTKKKESDK